jgi:multiple sugar transport system permease protein
MKSGALWTPRISGSYIRISAYAARQWGKKLFTNGLAYSLLTAWMAFSLLPLIWLLSEASKPATQALSIPINFIPSRFELFHNVVQVFRVIPFARYFANSVLIVAVLGTTDILVSSMGGYALAKFRFPGRQIVFLFILGTTMISFIVIIVPVYVLVRNLGWLDSYLGIMAPGFVSAFGVFFMRQYITSIPNDYLDAARIDGASEFGVYWSVIMPMIRPAIVTLGIFRFIWEWDSMLWPMIVIGNPNLRTLPLGLTLMADQLGWSPHYSMTHVLTACLLAILPVITIFLFMQRQFMSAMTMSGLKF